MEEKNSNEELVKEIKKISKSASGKKLILIVVSIVAVLCLCLFLALKSKDNKDVIETSSTLDSILEINELHACKYYYSGVARQKNDKGEDEYYVSYEAYVTLGINVDDVQITVDNKNKVVTISLPQVKVVGGNDGYDVRLESLDTLNVPKKIEQNELYDLARKDIEERFNNRKDNDIYDIAEENIKSTFESFIKVALDYEVVFE